MLIRLLYCEVIEAVTLIFSGVSVCLYVFETESVCIYMVSFVSPSVCGEVGICRRPLCRLSLTLRVT